MSGFGRYQDHAEDSYSEMEVEYGEDYEELSSDTPLETGPKQQARNTLMNEAKTVVKTSGWTTRLRSDCVTDRFILACNGRSDWPEREKRC